MSRADMILKNIFLYLNSSKEEQRIVYFIIKSREIENIAMKGNLDASELKKAVEEIEQLIC